MFPKRGGRHSCQGRREGLPSRLCWLGVSLVTRVLGTGRMLVSGWFMDPMTYSCEELMRGEH